MHSNLRTKRNISNKKVFVGLSGGVDSAVSAALLKRDGYDVTGVFIRIVLPGYPCSAVRDRQDAMRVAAHLRIPYREIDLSQAYQEQVFAYTLAEFARGRTPNPDTLCNREIKFGLFFDWCMKEGADFVATGHYAQMTTHPLELRTSVDTQKDQSYFLWMVGDEQLSRSIFPVGNKEKTEVRMLAAKFHLPNARRKDSQGLCFLGDLSMQDMLSRELSSTPGNVLSEDGRVLGMHRGAALYTLGQRHGFSIGNRGSEQAPLYVIAKNIRENTITVSAHKFPPHAKKTTLSLAEPNWIGKVHSGAYLARYRYRQPLIKAVLYKEKLEVVLDEPHYVPAGQSLVLYQPIKEKDGLRCVGGGIVENMKLD